MVKAECASSPVMDPALTDPTLHHSDMDVNVPAEYREAGAASDDNIDPSMSNVPMDWAPSQLQQPLSATSHPDVEQDSEDNNHPTSVMTTTTRRNANGSVSSVFSGNRISCLKKEDGVPLWRKDIQFLFLNYVFENDKRVFTRASDGSTEHTFAEIYIDAMAKSSKCSQVLKEKLLTDRASAIDMAMICLLVNVGRMNTTLNFFPEMRARVRTYHAIPCLQAQQGSQAYKQLQDGPRLKSILKGAMEDIPQPGNIDDLLHAAKPRTNPVNLIFVLSQYAPRVSETHFFPPRDFFDLFMRTNISSRSRATAFLWLIWWYLESDFSIDDSQRNPFGPGASGEDGSNPIKVPPLELLSDEDAEQENVDTEEEIAYGEAKRQEREAIVANDIPAPASGPKKGVKTPMAEQQHNYRFRYSPYGSPASDSGGSRGRPSPSPTRETNSEGRNGQLKHHHRYDGDQTCSPSSSPRTAPKRSGHHAPHRMEALLNDNFPSNKTPPSTSSRRKAGGRSGQTRKSRRSKDLKGPHEAQTYALAQAPVLESQHTSGSRIQQPIVGSQKSVVNRTPYIDTQHPYDIMPQPGSPDAAPPSSVAASGGAIRTRARPQYVIEQSRRDRVSSALYDRMQQLRREKRHERRQRGALFDAWMKCNVLPSGYDSEEDEPGRFAGIDEISTLRTMGVENEDKDYDPVEAGDAGAAATQISKSFKRIARVIDGVKVPRLPERVRVSEPAKRSEFAPPNFDSPPDWRTWEALQDDVLSLQGNLKSLAKPKPISKGRKAPKTKGAPAVGETLLVADEGAASVLPPKKRKRLAPAKKAKDDQSQVPMEGQFDFSTEDASKEAQDTTIKTEPVAEDVQPHVDVERDADGTEDEALMDDVLELQGDARGTSITV